MRTLILKNLEAVVDEKVNEEVLFVIDMTKTLFSLYIEAPRCLQLQILKSKWIILWDNYIKNV